jgi:BirA family biotin operon repressor/biotin-[acetyl-CoA-carboxylase] ligase
MILPLPSPLIDPVRLQALLGVAGGRFDVDAIIECESTSSFLLDRASNGAPAGSVVVADRQTAGRGRRGRNWVSTPDSGLTFSLLWRFDGGVERLAGLSLAVGVAIARALEACGAAGISLKWPNDILLIQNGRYAKLGGILVELQTERRDERRGMLAVIGVGLNLHLPAADESVLAFDHPAASVAQALSPVPDRHELLAQMLIELADVLDRFSSGGFAVLRNEWLARNAWQDKPVRLLHDGVVENEGVCRGADAGGALLIETAEGLERCLSGDLSLRAL